MLTLGLISLVVLILIVPAAILLGVSVAVFAAKWSSDGGTPAWLKLFGEKLRQIIGQWWGSESNPGYLNKWYTWELPSRFGSLRHPAVSRFFVELPISQARYIEYHQRPRDLNPHHFDTYVTVTIPEIELLAEKLLALGQERHYDSYTQLCNTLAFVQQGIHYTSDLSPQTGQLIEYPKYPIETLAEKKGDCEDQAILAATLLTRMGYKVALLLLTTHVALGVAGFERQPGSRVVHPASGIRYLYAETSAPDWLPGEVPREFQPDLASGQFQILPVVSDRDGRPQTVDR